MIKREGRERGEDKEEIEKNRRSKGGIKTERTKKGNKEK